MVYTYLSVLLYKVFHFCSALLPYLFTLRVTHFMSDLLKYMSVPVGTIQPTLYTFLASYTKKGFHFFYTPAAIHLVLK